MRRRRYHITVQVTIVLSLLIMIGLAKAPLAARPADINDPPPQEMIDVRAPLPTRLQKERPAPPRPVIPKEVPDEALLEDQELALDHNLDLELVFDTPPAPANTESGQDSESPEPFLTVEEMPQLVGGMEVLFAKIVYPDIARRAGVEGRVTISFVVNETGRVTEATVLKGIGAGCDKAALEAVLASRFTPGRQRGKAVRVRMTLPIVFKLR